ncbi:MAG TPA: hypothetical protein VFR32_03490 [Gaiellaceae bacterium]|nr:hypothetical protein [Gaiellaceae bacterium]
MLSSPSLWWNDQITLDTGTQATARARLRPLDDFLPVYEFSERHRLEIHSDRSQVDEALRAVSIEELPGVLLLYRLRGLGRSGRDTRQPFLGLARIGAVELEDVPGHGVILGLTGQFWRLRGGPDLARPRTRSEFLAYDRPDVCRAVIDFRIAELASGRCLLTTETRVHVGDQAARRAFRRYWLLIRPFSGLTRILFLRAVRRRCEPVAPRA